MKKTIIIFSILFVLAFFFRADINDYVFGNVVKEVETLGSIPNDFGDIEVLFCQVDDCEGKLIEYIEKSGKIDCAFFDFDLEDVMEKLKEKEYRLIVDDRNLEEVKLSNVKNDERSALMHNKFCIFDENIIVTGSTNPTFNGVNRNDNNLVFIESKILVGNYKDEFNEMWDGVYGKGETVKNPKLNFNGYLIENYFCPEDNCEEHTLELLRSAEERIYFMIFSFTSDKIGEEILKNYHYGIEVKGVFDNTQAGSEYSEFNKMDELDVIRDKNPKAMHHKVFIVDDSVLFGSYNPTSSGNKKNDENILIIHDKEIAERFIEEFERILDFSNKDDG